MCYDYSTQLKRLPHRLKLFAEVVGFVLPRRSPW